ncbi:unnamed protein product [Prorocentrum cordatum]|uniref:Uncharacterized protein n=1 Tax=Prorocentrum cordatum TaxID=2364126 RepID=A0ABN9VN03_9DINO|nr:unnamed protein product [Polarella glacialis]
MAQHRTCALLCGILVFAQCPHASLARRPSAIERLSEASFVDGSAVLEVAAPGHFQEPVQLRSSAENASKALIQRHDHLLDAAVASNLTLGRGDAQSGRSCIVGAALQEMFRTNARLKGFVANLALAMFAAGLAANRAGESPENCFATACIAGGFWTGGQLVNACVKVSDEAVSGRGQCRVAPEAPAAPVAVTKDEETGQIEVVCRA